MQRAQRDWLLLQMDLLNRDAQLLQGREMLVGPGGMERSRAERGFSIMIFIVVGFYP